MPNASVADVRAEFQADSTIDGVAVDIEVISDSQIQTVGLDPAHLEVSEDLAGEGLSDERLALIERYLAVDYILTSGIDEVRRLESESPGDGSSYNYVETRSYRERADRLAGGILSPDKPDAIIGVPDSRGSSTGR